MVAETGTVTDRGVSKLSVLVNPSAGKPEPVLHTLQEVLAQAELEWRADVIGAGDSVEVLVERARDWGADLLAVYGGDGTVSSVAAAMAGTGLPLAILPGGTGNVMAAELGVPDDLASACKLLVGGSRHTLVDMGRVNGAGFILRVGVGLEADMVAQADPEVKDRFGRLAYVLAALGALQDRKKSRFHLEVDGERIDREAVTCVVANSGNLGRAGFSLAPEIRIDDGELDVVLLKDADLEAIAAVLQSARGEAMPGDALLRWQGQNIRVECDDAREVQVDGESGMQLPLEITIEARAVTFLQPVDQVQGD